MAPCSRGAREISGYDGVLRVRTERYRIVYSVSETALIAVTLKVGPCRNVYR